MSKTERFTPGQPVMWLYWPPHASYVYWQRVDAEVVKVSETRVTVRCWDQDGNEVIRHVDPDRLMTEDQNGYECGTYSPTHGDGKYPPKRRQLRRFSTPQAEQEKGL
jgi:hypothetical protein